jgi:ABC-type multidrug transport system permease subunit
MKKWVFSALISLIPIVCLLAYFSRAIQQAACLDSGGIWLGLYQGCDLPIEQGYYHLTISPISAVIFLAVWLFLIFLISIVLKHISNLSKTK